ncbi:hypothetical protein [Oricola sp.]|uniref:hypothetical protein n=1 Tax=Oricola sp. TaxID=1979950 RepID=UPI0025D862EA|nr:hypothetical protein [Oricola sp.]MCI5075529.1 hypothetical protein [Oricola sp.]
MQFRNVLAAGLIATMFTGVAQAADGVISSSYTKLDIQAGCVQISSYEAGASYSCDGLSGYGILFSEGDLRQSVFFGHVGPWYADGGWQSFGPFNYVNDTVEWRLSDGVPYATILRWFIETDNPATGSPDDAHRGEVLVVSKVGQPGVADACAVGYVDARVNPDANALAREIADTMAETFACGFDTAVYHGARGPLAGDPVSALGN